MSDYSAEFKVPPYAVRTLKNTDPEFYGLVGPLLSRREIVAELGAPVWDDDDKVWWVAVAGSGEVLGMVALRAGREVCSLYVAPGSRGRSVAAALLHNATMNAAGVLRATATTSSLELFKLSGFVQTGERGRYHLLERQPRVQP